MNTQSEEWKPGAVVNRNGLGELRYVPFEILPNIKDLLQAEGIYDPIAAELFEGLSDKLNDFSNSLGLLKNAA